jgi:hypothetical protein
MPRQRPTTSSAPGYLVSAPGYFMSATGYCLSALRLAGERARRGPDNPHGLH